MLTLLLTFRILRITCVKALTFDPVQTGHAYFRDTEIDDMYFLFFTLFCGKINEILSKNSCFKMYVGKREGN